MVSSLLVVLAAATLVATVFHFVRIPAIVAFITAGIIIGPSALKLVPSIPQVDLLTEVSAVLLMFTIGLDFSIKELMHFRRPLLYLGTGQILITCFFFTALFWAILPVHIDKALFLSFLVTLSSTAVAFKLLQDHRETETPYGRAAFSVLLSQDIAVIPMMIAVPFISSKQSITSNIFDSLFPFILLTLVVILILYIAGRYGLPFLLDRVSKTNNREIFFFTILLILAGTGALMHAIGLSLSLGAFIAGMLIGSSAYGKQATAQVMPLRDAFLSLFFVSIGMLLDLHFLLNNFHKVILFGIGIIGLKSLIIFLVVWVCGNSGGIARATTALLFSMGEFSFILAEIGHRNGILSTSENQYFVAAGIISLASTPFIYRKIPAIIAWKGSHRFIPESFRTRLYELRSHLLSKVFSSVDLTAIQNKDMHTDHVVIIGFGIGGQGLARVLSHLQVPFSVIETNPETVKAHADKIDIHYGDGTQVEVLKKVNIREARLVAILTSSGPMLSSNILSIRAENPAIPILVRTNYLRETDKITADENITFVIGEIETTIEIINQSMSKLDIEVGNATQLILELRNALRATT